MPTIDRRAIAGLITGYQHYLSPHKGYCCAHHVLHQRGSCSAFARKVVLRHGSLRLVPLLLRRFKACRAAFDKLQVEAAKASEKGGDQTYSDCPLSPRDPFSRECNYCGLWPFWFCV